MKKAFEVHQSSDTKLNADAVNSIYLQSDSENTLNLGTLSSQKGDIRLTAANGIILSGEGAVKAKDLILRAGLGMVEGMLAMIPAAKVGHIGLFRDPETHEPVKYYCKMPPDISERQVFVVDPMLATGGSAVAALDILKKEYGCRYLTLMDIIAAPEGVKAVTEAHPDVDLYVAAVDDHLNEHAYIVPGLGDAGDRIFGTK